MFQNGSDAQPNEPVLCPGDIIKVYTAQNIVAQEASQFTAYINAYEMIKMADHDCLQRKCYLVRSRISCPAHAWYMSATS